LHIAGAQQTPQVNIQTPSHITNDPLQLVPLPVGYPSQHGPSLASGSVNDSHYLMPPTPASPAFFTTPDSSGASTTSSPEPSSPRQKRRQLSTPYARPKASQRSTPGSSMEPTDAVALDNARNGVRRFVKGNPHAIEPDIGDPAAITIIGSCQSLGTYGKSLYSVFFFSSRSGKKRFTCHECGHVDARFSRALRHQRQEHFGHYPYLCQGGVGHPAW